MSKEHISNEEIERYARKKLSPQDLIIFLHHLGSCADCRDRLADSDVIELAALSIRSDLQAALVSEQDEHLQHEELDAYVQGNLDGIEREIVECHLADCPQCESVAADFRIFKTTRSNAHQRDRSAVADRLTSFNPNLVNSATRWAAVALAGAAVVVLVLLAVAVLSLRRQVVELREQASRAIESNKTEESEIDDARASLADLRTRLEQFQNPSAGSLAVLQDAGGRVSIDERGNLSGLESLPDTYRQAVKGAMVSLRIGIPRTITSLIGKAGTVRDETLPGDHFQLVAPVGTAVEGDRPTFRWRPLPGAASYVVRIYDSNFKTVSTSPDLSANDWKPSSGLKRGIVYGWQVVARRNGEEISSPTPPAPEARFKMVEATKAIELQRVKHDYPESHLLLGVLYQRAGLLDDAEAQFQALLDANPKSAIAQGLLRNLKTIRR